MLFMKAANNISTHAMDYNWLHTDIASHIFPCTVANVVSSIHSCTYIHRYAQMLPHLVVYVCLYMYV